MNPDRRFHRDQRVDLRGMGHRSGITLPATINPDGSAAAGQYAHVPPGVDLALAALPHREIEVGMDESCAALVGTRQCHLGPYMPQPSALPTSEALAAVLSTDDDGETILAWLLAITGFHYAPAALWKLAAWQIGWLVAVLTRLRRGGPDARLIVAERRSAAAVRQMFLVVHHGRARDRLVERSGAVLVGRALVDLVACTVDVLRDPEPSKTATAKRKDKLTQIEAHLASLLERVIERIEVASRTPQSPTCGNRLKQAVEAARKLIDDIALFSVANESWEQRTDRLHGLLARHATASPMTAAHLRTRDTKSRLNDFNERLRALAPFGAAEPAWPREQLVGLSVLCNAERKDRLDAVAAVRTDLVFRLMVTRRLDRIHVALPWFIAPSWAFPAVYGGPVGALAQLFEAARAMEIAGELKRRLFDAGDPQRLHRPKALSAAKSGKHVQASVHPRTRAGFLVAHGSMSHAMLGAVTAGGILHHRHPLARAMAGRLDWSLRHSLADHATASLTATVRTAELRDVPARGDNDVPRYMGLSLVETLTTMLVQTFDVTGRGPRTALYLAAVAEGDKPLNRLWSGASLFSPCLATRELLRSMLKCLDAQQLGPADEWRREDVDVLGSGSVEARRADGMRQRHKNTGRDENAKAIRSNASARVKSTAPGAIAFAEAIRRSVGWGHKPAPDNLPRLEDLLAGRCQLDDPAPLSHHFLYPLWFAPEYDRHLIGWIAAGAPASAPIVAGAPGTAVAASQIIGNLRRLAPGLLDGHPASRRHVRAAVPFFTGLSSVTADAAHLSRAVQRHKTPKAGSLDQPGPLQERITTPARGSS